MNKNGKINIGQNIKIVPGFPFNSRLFNNDGEGLPLIRIRDLLQSKIETYYNGVYSIDFLIKEGDILIGMDGDFHIVKWHNKKNALLNQRILKVAQKEKSLIDINYFYYFLFPFLKDVWEKTTATTVKHLSTYDISDAYAEFPNVLEQRKIARILSTADAVIEKTQVAISKYKAIKQGMLHDLFTRGIDPASEKLRPTYEDSPELYKESRLGWIPKEWEVERLGEFSFITKLAGFEYTIHFDYSKSGPIIAVRALNIKQGKLNLENIHTIPKETSDILPRSQLKKGDLVISYVGTVGQVAVIQESNKFHLAPNVAKISVEIKEINPFYLNQFLNADIGQNEIINLVSSTTQAALSMQNLREVLFIKPDLKEQDIITLKLESIDNRTQTEQTYLNKIQQIKAGLMADLLSGKKKVNVDEEPVN
jgi:type I restriction enzyme S subunit